MLCEGEVDDLLAKLKQEQLQTAGLESGFLGEAQRQTEQRLTVAAHQRPSGIGDAVMIDWLRGGRRRQNGHCRRAADRNLLLACGQRPPRLHARDLSGFGGDACRVRGKLEAGQRAVELVDLLGDDVRPLIGISRAAIELIDSPQPHGCSLVEILQVGRVEEGCVVSGLSLGLLVSEATPVAQVSVCVTLAARLRVRAACVAQRLLMRPGGGAESLGFRAACVHVSAGRGARPTDGGRSDRRRTEGVSH
jgi:hypothetical protein